MRHLGVCYRTAWRLKHKLMAAGDPFACRHFPHPCGSQAMTEREASRRLGNLVQIDDAYLGGEHPGGKRGGFGLLPSRRTSPSMAGGRGSENKRPFVIALQTTDDGRPGCAVIDTVPGFTKAALTDWAKRRLEPDTDIYSDGLNAFAAVIDQGHAHTVIEAGGGRAACEATGARWVNVVLGNLKRALDGTYHAFAFFKYAHRYLAETAWRFNRRFRMEALVPRLLVAAARCQPWPERRLRDVAVFGG